MTKSGKANFPDNEILFRLAEFYKVFGDTSRVKLLFTLLRGELCVSALADSLGMSQSATSHQLRVLKAAKLVKFRRDGKTAIYSLSDSHIKTILDQGLEHISE